MAAGGQVRSLGTTGSELERQLFEIRIADIDVSERRL
jgi:hypothetical protein